MTDADDSAPSAETTESRNAAIRALVGEMATQFARRLVDQGFDRVAVMNGYRDACAALRDDALRECEPGGNA